MKAGIYIRVSTIEQKEHGMSVASQEQALKDYCNENGYEIVKIYNDAGISASKSYKHRPALLEMLNDCQLRKIDILLFTKLDRFFRNVPDYYACIEQMNDVPWKAIWEDYETITSSGKFKVNIMLSIAQAESDRTSERIKAVKDYQRSIGAFVGGTAPIGYKIKGSSIFKDEDTMELVELIFSTFLQTKSVNEVLDVIRSKGYERSKHGLYIMLKHPVYAGDYNGYKCDAYITWEEHLEIVNYLERNSKGRHTHTKEPYLFSGIIKCKYCKKPLTAATSYRTRKDKQYQYPYYECRGHFQRTCDKGTAYVRESKIEQYLLEHLENEYKLHEAKISAESIHQEVIDAQKKIALLEAKLERIGIRFEDGDITKDEYKSKRDSIRAEILQLKSINIPVKKELPDNWEAIYEELDKEHRRMFWNNILTDIWYGEDSIEIRI